MLGLTKEWYQDEKGEWRWRVWAKNNKKVGNSGEGYKDKEDVERGAYLTMLGLLFGKVKITRK